YIHTCKIRHENASYWPIDHVYTRDVSGAYCHIEPLNFTGMIKSAKIIWVMRKIGIHFIDVFISICQCPFETADIRSTQTQLSGTFFQMNSPGKLILCNSNEICGSIG